MTMDKAKDRAIIRRVLRGTVSNFTGKVVTLGTAFLLTPFILHRLGPEEFGLWALVSSVVSYGSLLDLGIAGAVVKYVAEYQATGSVSRAKSLIATAWTLYSILAIIAITLSVGLAQYFNFLFPIPTGEREIAAKIVLLSGVTLGISILASLPQAVFRGLQRFDIANFMTTFTALYSLAVTVTVLLLGRGVIGLIAANLSATVVLLVLGIVCMRRFAPDLQIGWRGAQRSQIGTIASFSFSLLMMDLAGRLQGRSDEVIIGASLSISAVTPYSLAQRLSSIAHLLTDQFMKVLLPLASELDADDDRARLRALLLTSTRLSLMLFLPIGGTLAVLSPSLLGLWIGTGYAQYASLVQLLIFAGLVNTFQWPAGAILQGMAQHRILASSSMIAGLVTVGLSMVLIRQLGLIGVALGILIPSTVEAVGFVLPCTMRLIGIGTDRVLAEVIVPVLLPAIPMIIVLHVLTRVLVPASWLLVGGFGLLAVVIYGGGYLGISATPSERQFVRGSLFRAWQLTQTRSSVHLPG